MNQMIQLTFPSVFATNILTTYNIGREADYNRDLQSLVWSRTKTFSIGARSKIIPRFNMFANYAKRTRERDVAEWAEKDQYESKYGFTYTSASECWGLSFLRWKKFEAKERGAEYALKLVVMFMSQRRELPYNLAQNLGTVVSF